jgi:histidinol-phosphate aminotransferase
VTGDQSANATGALRLHYNENTAGCSTAVIDALRSITREELAVYPDYAVITAKTARWLGVDSDWIHLTNGLDEGLYAVTQYGVAHADAGQANRRPQFVLPEPSFEMFEEFSSIVRAELIRVAPEPNFRFPLTAVLDAVTPSTRVIYLVDPNNPTGLSLPGGFAERIAAAAPEALVFVDEAYADFRGRTLIGPALDRHRNLVIGRTFAKGHGLAGLRVGALVAHPETMRRLRPMLPPFNVNICAVRALDAALDDQGYLDWYVAQTTASKALVYEFCRRHRLTYWPSDANFVLVKLGEHAATVAEALRDRGFLVRDKSAAPGCGGCLRFTTGVLDHTAKTMAALEDSFASRTN